MKKKSKKKKADKIVIPDEASEPDVNVEDFLILLYGPPGVGKSTFCSQLDDPVFIATEPGLKFLKTRQIVCGSWEVFQAIVMRLEKGIKAGCYVVDTVDNLSKFCLNYVCDKNNFTHPADQEWGKGWEAYFNEWHHWILRLCNIGKGVVFVGHSAERQVTFRNMKVDKTMPAIPNTTYKLLKAACDFILYAGFKRSLKKDRKTYKETRVLYTQPSMEIDAKDRSKLLPDEMPLDCEQFKAFFSGKEEPKRKRKKKKVRR